MAGYTRFYVRDPGLKKREHFKLSLTWECDRLWRARGEFKNEGWESRRFEKSYHKQKPLFFIILINKTSLFYKIFTFIHNLC